MPAPKQVKVASWNVNGIRACAKNGFSQWATSSESDFILLQEVRADLEQIPAEISNLPNFEKYWFPSTSRKGYSGTGILSRQKAVAIRNGIECEDFDCEGRVLAVEFENVSIVSAYFPNSQDGGKRLSYKIGFCEALEKFLLNLRRLGKPVVLGGDFNIAHRPIDLARPDANEDSPGYLPEERAWMEQFLNSGWVDTYRSQNPTAVKYSWWSARTGARARGVGWRIDYNVVHESDRNRILGADIEDGVMGSDHCPVTLRLALD
jgi:exodeoxyribonuclease III